MALSLLPPDVIPAGFKQLQKQVETSEARAFMAYYNTHWLEKWGPEHYSVFRKEVRTNKTWKVCTVYITHRLVTHNCLHMHGIGFAKLAFSCIIMK